MGPVRRTVREVSHSNWPPFTRLSCRRLIAAAREKRERRSSDSMCSTGGHCVGIVLNSDELAWLFLSPRDPWNI